MKLGDRQMETVKPENIGQMNKAIIVRLLKEHENLSRADLTRMLDMSFPSVSLLRKRKRVSRRRP